MATLERFTTEYVVQEDRIRLSGELAGGETVVLWLTQRLVRHLGPHLTGWLEAQLPPAGGHAAVQATHQDMVQGFAQQAARAQLAPEPPVRAQSPVASWRVDVVHIARSADAVVLTLQGESEAQQAVVPLPAHALRQWLGIVYDQCLRGDWPTTAWPAWMEAGAPAHAQLGSVVVH